ncbi:31996_t:CDS:2, partial [Gigaspora margarita]
MANKETTISANKSSDFQLLEVINIPAKCKIEKNKEGRPRMPIWNDYDEGEEDGYGHFEASCHYCDKGKWQCEKPSTMKAHLVLYCKGPVPDNIRR